MENRFKAIILDMDGVLIDTETLVFDVFRAVFAPFNIDLSNDYQYKFIGQPFSNNLVDIRRDFGIDFDKQLVRDRFDRIYEEMLRASPLTVQNGIREIVQDAHKNGIKMALCTTSTWHHVEAVFAKVREDSFDPAHFFNVVVTGDSVARKKPHPEPYLVAAARLGESPRDCLVIEDSISGVQSAKAAGCFCVALRQPYNRHISFAAADLVVENLVDVLNIVLSD
ncbi:HAD family phosphatase [candidate division KSB1 bacterium]|nr:HAD family phosphatase [candidate division KSB1 bacterium]RQW04985.1 MAG: HAD family phosphatase [candidate division KSB1 bacterium]